MIAKISNTLLPIYLFLVGAILLSVGPAACSKPHDPDALIYAVKEADLTRVKELVAAGADINSKDVVGCSALHWAVGNHRIEIAQLLVGAGANVNLKDNLGLTPLLTAADTGRDGLVRLLVENGAEVNTDNDDYELPLYRAILGSHTNTVKVLQGSTALDWATEKATRISHSC